MAAPHTGDLLPPADVPFGGPAGGASARYRVAAAPPGVPADHAHTVGPAYLPGTVVAEGSAAEGALDYPVGFFLFQSVVSEDGMGCVVIKPLGQIFNSQRWTFIDPDYFLEVSAPRGTCISELNYTSYHSSPQKPCLLPPKTRLSPDKRR